MRCQLARSACLPVRCTTAGRTGDQVAQVSGRRGPWRNRTTVVPRSTCSTTARARVEETALPSRAPRSQQDHPAAGRCKPTAGAAWLSQRVREPALEYAADQVVERVEPADRFGALIVRIAVRPVGGDRQEVAIVAQPFVREESPRRRTARPVARNAKACGRDRTSPNRGERRSPITAPSRRRHGPPAGVPSG